MQGVSPMGTSWLSQRVIARSTPPCASPARPGAFRAGRRRAARRLRPVVRAVLVPFASSPSTRTKSQSPTDGNASSSPPSSSGPALQERGPAERPGPSGNSASFGGAVLSALSGTQSLAEQLWASLRFRDARSVAVEPSLLADTAARAREAERQARKETGSERLPPNLESFLKPTGLQETRYIRVLASLCALTYKISKLTDKDLSRRHGMTLVTTNLACSRVAKEVPRTASQVFDDSDAMAATIATVEEVQRDRDASQVAPATSAALASLARADAAAGGAGRKARTASPTDLVAAKLYEAAAAAAAVTAPLANNITTFTAKTLPMQSVASSLRSAAAAGHSTAAATIATVTAAVEATWSGRRGAAPAPVDALSPTDWFVCDDAVGSVRYFAVMGSDNVDHWKTNLTFDPVTFEDPALGVKVHRGVYEAAQVLYDRFLPLVEEHVRGNPFAKVAFTGHSLGGSIATLLMLMYYRRGVLPPTALTTTYTFGAPAVFCEGCAPDADCACDACATDECHAPATRAARGRRGAGGMLAQLGLKEGSVKNVIMAKDIVPRAFTCDYSLVADLLKRVGDSFREHSCLAGQRSSMYRLIGKALVLQPADSYSFVKAGEGYHPSLPEGPGLYVLRKPSMLGSAASSAISEVAALSLGEVNPPKAPTPASVAEAVEALMDWPHPLDILGDTAAYGDDGAISRYHNPDNYMRALGGVLRTKPLWRLLPSTSGGGGGPLWYMPLAAAAGAARGKAAGGGAGGEDGGGWASGKAGLSRSGTYIGSRTHRPLPLYQLGGPRSALGNAVAGEG